MLREIGLVTRLRRQRIGLDPRLHSFANEPGDGGVISTGMTPERTEGVSRDTSRDELGLTWERHDRNDCIQTLAEVNENSEIDR